MRVEIPLPSRDLLFLFIVIYGPDLASSEWRSAVEFRLGIRGNPGIPAVATEEWCSIYIDKEMSRSVSP